MAGFHVPLSFLPLTVVDRCPLQALGIDVKRDSMTSMPAFAPDVPPLEIGMLLYPGMTLLDLAGPQAALGMHGRTHLFWKTLEPGDDRQRRGADAHRHVHRCAR